MTSASNLPAPQGTFPSPPHHTRFLSLTTGEVWKWRWRWYRERIEVFSKSSLPVSWHLSSFLMVPQDKDVMSAFKHNAAFDILCRTGVKGVEMEEASLEEK